MQSKSRKKKKTYYTVEEANAMLPLLRVILRDITQLAVELREDHERLLKIEAEGSNDSELSSVYEEFQRRQERLRECEQELLSLKVELKDRFRGLVDFPCKMDDRDVYLCWKLGEDEVEHWHEVDAGFAGRRKLTNGAINF